MEKYDIKKGKASREGKVLPEKLEKDISETIANLPKIKQDKGKMFKKTVTAAAITLATIIGLSAQCPVYAQNILEGKSVFQLLSDKNMIDKDYINYKSDLNLSKTSNGVTVTINSIVYDGIDLSIGYTVESNTEFKSTPHILDKEFKIDGNETSFSSSGTGYFIDKNTYVGVDTFNVNTNYLPKEVKQHVLGGDVNIPENFTMDLNIREFLDGIKGEWDFKFKVSTDKVKGKVKDINTFINLSKIKSNLTVNEIITTPINTVLRTTENSTVSDCMFQNYNYFVFDDKGRNLKMKGSNGNSSGENNKLYSQYMFRNIYEDTKSVTFIPVEPTKEVKEFREKLQNNGEELKVNDKEVPLNLNGSTILSEGKFGDYKINQIEFLEDKTIIHYECTNLLSAQPDNFVIVDESGKEYGLMSEKVKVQDVNKFIAEIEPLSKE